MIVNNLHTHHFPDEEAMLWILVYNVVLGVVFHRAGMGKQRILWGYYGISSLPHRLFMEALWEAGKICLLGNEQGSKWNISRIIKCIKNWCLIAFITDRITTNAQCKCVHRVCMHIQVVCITISLPSTHTYTHMHPPTHPPIHTPTPAPTCLCTHTRARN